jgi:hypothetical protein
MDKSEKQLVACIFFVLIGGIIFEVATYNILKKKYNQ